ncbi:NYN domain-containing protein, partial [Alienimonas sp. DA493]|uniref:NYN domain-containing protein n=1 Tax=Alienimonas sp. DA493 TaxID=3373605 RepID=UPI003754CF5B
MSGSINGQSALFIDLENFVLGREENWRLEQDRHPGEDADDYDCAEDLRDLITFATRLSEGRSLAVKRAYANYNVRRENLTSERWWDYYLQGVPNVLLGLGVEPIQVFRFPGGKNKNASDLRMAMDAAALAAEAGPHLAGKFGGGHFSQFILATSDSDFIPLSLELRRAGAEVTVIGVQDKTKPVFERFCDRFEYFEDLRAARDLLDERQAEERAALLRAVGELVDRHGPIRAGSVRTLVEHTSRTPGGEPLRFDPMQFGCGSAAELIERHGEDAGLVLKRTGGVQVVARAEEPTSAAPPANGYRVNGSSGADGQGSDRHGADGKPADATEGVARISLNGHRPIRATPEHSPALYRRLLLYGHPRIALVPAAAWQEIASAVVARVAGQQNGDDRPRIYHQDLVSDITEVCAEAGIQDAAAKVRSALFQMFKAGCFLCDEHGPRRGHRDFHWSRPAVLDPALPTYEHVRDRVWRFVTSALSEKLRENGMDGAMHVGFLAELLCGPDPSPSDMVRVAAVARAAQCG